MRRTILSTALIFIASLLLQSTAWATDNHWKHRHSDLPKVHNLGNILKSGEIVGVVDFCGSQGISGSIVDLVGESFSADLGATGTFRLRYVPRGTYTLRARIPGQPPHTQPVTVNSRRVTDVGNLLICPDNDNDGFAIDQDCNDNNGAIFPGAEELCDGVDNDCDGEVDAPGCNCTDADNDGFFAQDGCGTAVDCNDDSNVINPGVSEICDGIDNNCDGASDEIFDTDTDPNNCGACNNACGSGQCGNGICLNECGNGVLEAGNGEACDDGSVNSDTTPDACRTDCTLPVCGDSVIDTGEECDDGNTEDGDGCQAECRLPLACDGTPDGESVACGTNEGACQQGTQTCNDGEFGPCVGEIPPADEVCNGVDDNCDGTVDDGGVCSVCGNGVVETGEQCDDGAESATCDADCSLVLCGDGVTNVTAGEQCDDGNSNNADDCPSNCQAAFCGDGFIHTIGSGIEQCDDGNNIDGDGCQGNCTIPECSVSNECPDPNNASGVCENDGTCGFTCSNGFANCDGSAQNGCEVFLNSNPSSCNFTTLGAVRGDTGADTQTTQNRREANFRVQVNEADSGLTGHDLGVRINLTVPQGADYDLQATCDNCGGSLAGISTNAGSANEQIFLRWEEDTVLGVPTGSDSGRVIYIRVIFKSGNVCDNWVLTVTGNSFGGPNTCSPK